MLARSQLPELQLVDPTGHSLQHKSAKTVFKRESTQNPYVPKLRATASEGMYQAATRQIVGSYEDDIVTNFHARFPMDGASTARGTSPRSRSHPASARGVLMAQTARPVASDSAQKTARRKKQERMHDFYVTAVSKETLLSEQYDKELSQGAEQERALLQRGAGARNRGKREEQELVKARTKLEKRCNNLESRLNGMETYNARLVDVINAIRKQNAPHREAMKKADATTGKLATEMAKHKQLTHKALDERERLVDQLKHLREETAQEQVRFLEAISSLEHDNLELDEENRHAMRTLEQATEETKQQQYLSMRTHRSNKERLEVRYGYLRSQLEGIDREFRELERIVGVHFAPSQPDSLQQIIDKFAEKEASVMSLQKFWASQNDEIEALQAEVAAMHAIIDAHGESDADADEAGGGGGGGGDNKAAAAEAGAASAPSAAGAALSAGRESAGKAPTAESEERLAGKLDGVFRLVERIFRAIKCEAPLALTTKGCSTSTIGDYLSCLDSRLDELELLSAMLRKHASAAPHLSVRQPNKVLEKFLAARVRNVELRGSSSEALKTRLPSIADQNEAQEGEAECHDGRKAANRDAAKGSVDTQRRDEKINAWVQRQKSARSASKPSIREFYQPQDTTLQSSASVPA